MAKAFSRIIFLVIHAVIPTKFCVERIVLFEALPVHNPVPILGSYFSLKWQPPSLWLTFQDCKSKTDGIDN